MTFEELPAQEYVYWLNRTQQIVDRGYTDKEVEEIAKKMYEHHTRNEENYK